MAVAAVHRGHHRRARSRLPATTAPATTAPATTAPPDTTAATTAATTPPPPAVVGLTEAQADAALLTIDDVNAATGLSGWNVGSYSSGGNLCGLTAPDAAVERTPCGTVHEGGIKNVQITSSTLSFASTDDVNLRRTTTLRLAATDCPDPTETSNGVTADLTFTAPQEVNVPGVDRTWRSASSPTSPASPRCRT